MPCLKRARDDTSTDSPLQSCRMAKLSSRAKGGICFAIIPRRPLDQQIPRQKQARDDMENVRKLSSRAKGGICFLIRSARHRRVEMPRLKRARDDMENVRKLSSRAKGG